MLKKTNRPFYLNNKEKAEIFDTSLFRIKIYLNKEGNKDHMFVISKKTAQRAVDRNKTKRVLKKAIKSFIKNFKPGISIIVIAKTILEFKDEEDILLQMGKIFKKAGILNENINY